MANKLITYRQYVRQFRALFQHRAILCVLLCRQMLQHRLKDVPDARYLEGISSELHAAHGQEVVSFKISGKNLIFKFLLTRTYRCNAETVKLSISLNI